MIWRCIQVALAALLPAAVTAQVVMEGELRVSVRDPAGAPVSDASVTLAAAGRDFRAATATDTTGRARVVRIPPGVYQVRIVHPGFEPVSESVEVRSAVPQQLDAVLRLAAAPSETVVVREGAPLLDPADPALFGFAGRQQLQETLGTTPGRGLIDILTTMPGWLLEANAVLHPRGSEYDTQYVIDGMPLYDNRSIALAPAFDAAEFEAVTVITGGIPAEFGRRLGGVIALDTRRSAQPGSHTEADLRYGSYQTATGSLTHNTRTEKTAILAGMHAARSRRFLDPPSLENFTNTGRTGGAHLRVDRDLRSGETLMASLRSGRTAFEIPNDPEQQAAGQRQDRSAAEASGQLHYQRAFASRNLFSARGMVRDLNAHLWSNPSSTPVWVEQERGFRESALITTLTREGERHTLRAGADVRLNSLRENFRFAEADEYPEVEFDYRNRRRGTETGAFVQDHVRLGNFAAAVGLRFDTYRLLVRESALSPRVAASYFVPQAGILFRGSYDRVFQPPPFENLLLSSGAGDGLPVPASRGNFFEAGIRKTLGRVARMDVSHYVRDFRNYLDDEVFLNTGVSFPITFASARIRGTEARLEVPQWRRVSGFASYANMRGTAEGPVTGGVFLEAIHGRIAITQDQRNTLAAQARVEASRRVWFIGGFRFGSGLPVEQEDGEEDDDDDDDVRAASAISPEILEQVDFERGRVRPNWSLDAAVGVDLSESVSLQADARNLTDRLNVINFTGVLSGTALAPRRQVSLRLRVRF